MDPRIRRVIARIAAIDREIDLTEVAREMNISASRLRHLFKDETGLSPLQYLKAERIEQARVLLETTYLSVKEIMIKVGMKDKSDFARDFKNVYGLPPVKYRKQYFTERFKSASTQRAR